MPAAKTDLAGSLARLLDSLAGYLDAAAGDAREEAARDAAFFEAVAASAEPLREGPRCSADPAAGDPALYYDGLSRRPCPAVVVSVAHRRPGEPWQVVPEVVAVVFGHRDRAVAGPVKLPIYDHDSPRPDGTAEYCTRMPPRAEEVRGAREEGRG